MNEDEKLAIAKEFIDATIRNRKTIMEGTQSQDIKRSEFMLLMSISERLTPEVKGVKVSDLSTALDITPAAVTHMINSLEKKDYIERLSDKSDRRVVLVSLTEKGKQAVDNIKESFFRDIKELISFLGEKDSREMIRLLNLVTDYHYQKRNKE